MEKHFIMINKDIPPLYQFLQKPALEYTKDDILRFCREYKIEMINFRYVAADGKLKTLNFPINSMTYVETILTYGERVSGSTLFPFIDSDSSDLYIVPRYRSAFVNPFTEIPALELFCSFYTNEGKPLESDPGYVLRKADEAFSRETGCQFRTLGELEYYVIAPAERAYPGVDQKGYHESEPFAKFEQLRVEVLHLLANAGCAIKYGHSETGCFTADDLYYEQHEIEFLPTTPERAAEQILLAKWMLRKLAYDYGLDISFAPKLTVGKAGSGLHFHIMVEKNGINLTAPNGHLSDISLNMIAGILDAADALTAFGKTIPLSYLRLVPEQKAPVRICWGDRNRSVVIRVPLSWRNAGQMICDANPNDAGKLLVIPSKETFEFRVPDGSANICLTLAGLIVAALRGIKMPGALNLAKQLYADTDIFKPENREKFDALKSLPFSCVESAEALEKKKEIFMHENIFSEGLINSQIERLRAFNDIGLIEKLHGQSDEIKNLVNEFFHVG